MIIKCENCNNNFCLEKTSFYYLKLDSKGDSSSTDDQNLLNVNLMEIDLEALRQYNLSIAGVCNDCYQTINTNLKIQVDDLKIKKIKEKAHRLMLQKKLLV